MTQLTVCMPSNRGFEKSFRAIETALAFCEARDAILVVSDNSRDDEKLRYWRGRSKHLNYLEDAPLTQAGNAMNVFGAVKTPFLMPIGDDDELFTDPAHTPVDLATLSPDIIGVKPMTEIFSPGTDLAVRRAYGLEGDTPGLRLRQFFDRNQGDNTAFYSAFRAGPYLAMTEFFITHHPTRGSYCDWQLAMSLFIAGKLTFDPSIIYRYNAVAWATQEAIDVSARKLYTDAGLPENFKHYNAMLRAMDLFVFSMRNEGRLSRQQLSEVQSGELCDLFDLGFTQAVQLAGDGDPNLVQAAQKGLREANPMLKFLHGAALLDCFVPGLKAKYIAFLKLASG
jgi:hypothetical protein